MAKFEYTLPSGAQFVVNGPAGATQAQADRIFYEQVASGALVGYEVGQTLTSAATKITTFELSRLERGTAGVDSPIVYSISQGLPVVVSSGTGQTQETLSISGNDATAVLSILEGLPIVSGIPSLVNVPLQAPVTQADIVSVNIGDLGPSGVGPLTPYQIQALLAQLANLVAQAADEITREKGIGQYGFNAYQLEQAGYIKPGTSLRFFAVDPEDFVSVMSSPSVWTGLNGVNSLNDLLTDPNAQTHIQTDLMELGYNSLTAAGIITNVITPAVSLSSGQVYTQGGLRTASALTLLGAGVNSTLDGILKNINSNSSVLSSLLSSPITNLKTLASGALNNLGVGSLNFTNLSSILNSKVTGDIGALVTNASKFGVDATALWSKSGLSGSLTDITGSLSNLNINSLTSNLNLNSISTNLTNLVPGSLSNLTSQLDIFGKGSQFSLNFANPLGNLGNLGDLGNLSSIGDLTKLPGVGAITNQLSTALSGQLSGVLGNFGGLANLGSLGSLFGGGGDLVSGTQVAAGFSNTVNRTTVDAAFGRILGSTKVPLPNFTYPSLPSIASRLDISLAQNFLKDIRSSSSSVFGQNVTI